MSDEIDFMGDVEDAPVSDDALKTISSLAEKLQELMGQQKAMEESLRELKEDIRRVQEVELPDAMTEVGMSSFSLTNGKRVEVKDFVHANIPKKYETEAFEWLRENGHGDLIKNVLTAKFGRGQEEEVQKAMQALVSLGLQPEQKSQVAWNTLTAWAKEQLANGNPIPMEILGVYQGRKAEVK